MAINVLDIVDFLDDKLIEVRKNDSMTWAQRMTAYNVLIDVQEFIKKIIDEVADDDEEDGETKEGENSDGIGFRYPN